MLADKTKLKIGLRKFLAQDPTRTTTLTWDEEKSVIDKFEYFTWKEAGEE